MAKTLLQIINEKGRLKSAGDNFKAAMAQKQKEAAAAKTPVPQVISQEEMEQALSDKKKASATKAAATRRAKKEVPKVETPKKEEELIPLDSSQIDGNMHSILQGILTNLERLQNKVNKLEGNNSGKTPSGEPQNYDISDDAIEAGDIRSAILDDVAKQNAQRAKQVLGQYMDSEQDPDVMDKVNVMGHLYASFNNMLTGKKNFSYRTTAFTTSYLEEIIKMSSLYSKGDAFTETFKKNPTRIKISSEIIKQFISDVAELARKHHYYSSLYRE